MSRTLTVLAVVALLVVVPGAQAGVANADGAQEQDQPTEIDSCTTITESGEYVLTRDVRNSSEVCIRIEASNVTLDGNGHTIDGTQNVSSRAAYALAGYGFAERGIDLATVPNATLGVSVLDTSRPRPNRTLENVTLEPYPLPTSPRWDNVGIRVGGTDPVSDVTVTDVQIQEFFFGISTENVTSAAIRDATFRRNGEGIDLANTTESTVASSRLTQNRWGLYLYNATDIDVQQVDATGNGETGLYSAWSRSVRFVDNTANRNGASGLILDDTNRSTVTGNDVSRNAHGGLPLYLSSRNRITDNAMVANGHEGVGLYVESDDNRLANNTIRDTQGREGFWGHFGESGGVVVSNSSDNLIRDTVAADNARWTFFAENESRNNTVENATLDSRVSASFRATDVAVDGARPTLDARTDAVRTGVFVANTSQEAQIRGLRVEWSARPPSPEATTAEMATAQPATPETATPTTEPATNATTESDAETGG